MFFWFVAKYLVNDLFREHCAIYRLHSVTKYYPKFGASFQPHVFVHNAFLDSSFEAHKKRGLSCEHVCWVHHLTRFMKQAFQAAKGWYLKAPKKGHAWQKPVQTRWNKQHHKVKITEGGSVVFRSNETGDGISWQWLCNLVFILNELLFRIPVRYVQVRCGWIINTNRNAVFQIFQPSLSSGYVKLPGCNLSFKIKAIF